MSLVIPIQPSDAPLPDGNLLRRGLLALLREVDEREVHALHSDPGPGGRPWTISDPFMWQDRWRFRLTTVGRRTCQLAAAALRPGRLAGARGWAISSRSEWRVRALRADQILSRHERTEAALVITQLSPCEFSARDGAPTPWPTASTHLATWWRRWHALLGPDTLPPALSTWAQTDAVLKRGVEIASWDLTARRLSTSRGLRPLASSGSLTLRIRGGIAEVDGMLALARFGAYCGVGRKLAHGLGQVLVGPRPAGWDDLAATHLPLAPVLAGSGGSA